MNTGVNANSQVYYGGQYWNDFPRVLEYMCENLTGDRRKWWTQDFQERFCAQSFEHALVLNCGNGWVEREFVDKGMVRKVVAFDYSLDLLCVAQEEKGNRPIHYFQADVNQVDFPADHFDLVINVAALHHVQRINRLCRVLCRTLRADGVMVNFDYIGPRRNQYSLWQWYWIQRVNRSLPAHVRKEPLVHPHLPTMLYTDPTEAIHSNLIIESVARYFDVRERHDTGGGIAYEILTHNAKLGSIPPDELNPHLDHVLALDKKYTATQAVPPLFAYWIAQPHKSTLSDTVMLERYEMLEQQREAWARAHRGTYSYGEYLFALTLPILIYQARRLWARLNFFRSPR